MILSNLSSILDRKHIKISKVIADTGITRPTLTNLYYNDAKGINFDTLSTLCKYLSVTPSDLLTFYNIDIKNISVTFDNTIDIAKTEIEGKTIDVISSARCSGIISFEQVESIDFKGHVSQKPNTHEYDLDLEFQCTPKDFDWLAPVECIEYLQNQIVASILQEFIQFDEEADITSVYYTYAK